MRNPSKKTIKRLKKVEVSRDPIEPLDYIIQAIKHRVIVISKGKVWNDPKYVNSSEFWAKMQNRLQNGRFSNII